MSAPKVPARLAYFLKDGIDPRAIPLMPYLIRLMMSADAMASAFRWHEVAEKKSSATALVDMTMASIATAGWAGETRRFSYSR